MKDFSLFYGPVRTWLPVVAMAVLGLVVIVSQSSGSDRDCTPSASAECAEPLLGERQLLGNDGDLDVAPAGSSTDRADRADPSPWDDFEPDDGSVPFVSLQPSPEPMTDAGQDLVRSATADEGANPTGP